MATSVVPIRCIERHPTTQTVWFKGCPINLSEIADSYRPPLQVSYLSHIFRGKRTPSVEKCRLIADALGMQLQAFLDALEGCPYGAPRQFEGEGPREGEDGEQSAGPE